METLVPVTDLISFEEISSHFLLCLRTGNERKSPPSGNTEKKKNRGMIDQQMKTLILKG